jgi:hypothetical protein
VVTRGRCGRLRVARVRGRLVLAGEAGEAVQRVAAGGEVGEDEDAELVQGAGRPGAAQPQREGVDMGPGGESVGGVHLAAGDRGVPGLLAADLDPLPGPAGVLPAGFDGLGCQLHLQRGGLAEKLVKPQRRGDGGQDPVGERGVVRAEAAGVLGDHAGPGLVDQPGGHPRERARQPGRQVGGIVDRARGLNRAGGELDRKLLTGELARLGRPDRTSRPATPGQCQRRHRG